jgi:hypothetical protein
MHERETRIRTADGEMTTFVAHPMPRVRFPSPFCTWTASVIASR